MRGLIMIDRSMLKHHIVGINNPLRFAAWAWMLSSARYKDGIYYDAGHEINLKRGQFVCGRKFMAGETGMTEKQVRVFLAALERSGMCLKTVHPKGQGITIITICNYDAYQDYTAYKESKGPRSGPSKGQGRAKVGPHSVTPEETPDEIKVLKKDTKVSTKKSDPIFISLSQWASDEACHSFIAYRKKHKARALTERAGKMLATDLGKIFNAGHDPTDALGLAELRGWAAVNLEWYENAKGKHNGQLNNSKRNSTVDNDPTLDAIADAAAAF